MVRMKYKNTIYKGKEGVRRDLNLQTAPHPQALFCSFRKEKRKKKKKKTLGNPPGCRTTPTSGRGEEGRSNANME